MSTFTATHTYGGGFEVAIHATGCKHAIDPARTVGRGDTPETAFADAVKYVCDPDNDWPGAWSMKIVTCARKVRSLT
jgi:hypothetical protein